jgi:hypothetical protein
MKKCLKPLLLILLLVTVLSFSGCDFLMGIIDPMIGTWNGSMSQLSKSGGAPYATGTFVIHGDKTFTMTITMTTGGSGSGSGTYSSDAASKTATFTFSSLTAMTGPTLNTPYVMSYELTSSNSVLTMQSTALDTLWVLNKQ